MAGGADGVNAPPEAGVADSARGAAARRKALERFLEAQEARLERQSSDPAAAAAAEDGVQPG